MLKKVLLAGIAALGITGAAQAVPVVQGGSFTVDYVLPGAGSGPALTATTTYSNFNFVTPTQLTFNLAITNTTSSGGPNPYASARFTAFGWDISRVLTAASDNSGVFDTARNTNLSSNNVAVCLYSGPNCNGGGNGGLAIGASTSFTETFTFASTTPALEFTDFYAKFQTNAGSIEGGGTVRSAPPANVPEPMSLALVGVGLAGLGLTRARRQPA